MRMRSRPPATALLALSVISSVSSVSCSLLDRPRQQFLQQVLEPHSDPSPDSGAQYCKPSGQITDACCDFETAESVNHDLFGTLHDLVATPYFRYHKVDLYKECPFWSEQGSCMNRACGVETTQEDHIPEAWRSYTLGKLDDAGSKPAAPAGCSELAESDFCVLDDELDSDGVYVDLLSNPERFTGYAGPSANRVWRAIYEENCFSPVPYVDPSREGFPSLASSFSSSSPSPGSSPGSGAGVGGGGDVVGRGGSLGLSAGGWGESEKRLLSSLAGPRDAGDEVCLEKRVFYRVISGLHASISVHICDDYLDQQTGEWSPNLPCFVTRIGQHPERLENMYFTYILLLRALSRSGPQILSTMNETAGSLEEVERVRRLVDQAGACEAGRGFDEARMFEGNGAELLKSEFKSHFRNVSLIMDCVGCDKCRLWGKMQVTGLGTALKLLFSDHDDEAGPGVVLSRSEVVAFMNTLHRLSESLEAVGRFRELWAQRGRVSSSSSSSTSIPSSAASVSPSFPSHSPAPPLKIDFSPLPSKPLHPLNSAPPAAPSSSSHPSSSSSSPPPSENVQVEDEKETNATLAAREAFGRVWERVVGWCESGWRCIVTTRPPPPSPPPLSTALQDEAEGGLRREEL
ncbi:hypothetical protein JCM11641_004066 [Rhodosporidiobolus odoratus]